MSSSSTLDGTIEALPMSVSAVNLSSFITSITMSPSRSHHGLTSIASCDCSANSNCAPHFGHAFMNDTAVTRRDSACLTTA